MGKLTLLLVVAASIGGAYLTLSMQGLLGDSARVQSSGQADLLAREIAEGGHDLALSSMMGAAGFSTLSLARTGDIDPGAYSVDVDESVLPDRALLTVHGSYGGAVHTITSDHEFDRMEYPGPIWIDVPYATFDVSPSVQVSGGSEDLPVHYDRRQNDLYRLGGFLPAADVDQELADLASAGGVAYRRIGSAGSASGFWAGLLEDLNVRDAEELFQAALSAVTDRKAGPLAVTGDETWGATTASVTVVEGNLRLHGNAHVTGQGALVVDGSIVVEDNAKLDWAGLVIVRSDAAVMPVTFDGNRARITGGLVIVHRGYPPGGHLDLTVARDAGGMSAPAGDRTGAPTPWNDPGFPWFTHNHEFDIKPVGSPRGRRVVFTEGGGPGPHAAETRFHDLMTSLGSERVYLEFDNERAHGFSRFTVDLDGAAPLSGYVRDGFGTFARGTGSNRFRSQTFEADDLDELTVEVMALRSLQPRFDGVGTCAGDSWPFCIGETWDRKGALTLQVKRASDNKRLYDAMLYWHMRADEVADHEAEEDAWRAQIAAGMGYGAHITMGDGTRITYDRQPIVDLAEALGFDGNRIIQRGMSHRHVAASSARSADANAGSRSEVTVCHSGNTQTINATSLAVHLGHGDTAGACASPDARGAGAAASGRGGPGRGGPR